MYATDIPFLKRFEKKNRKTCATSFWGMIENILFTQNPKPVPGRPSTG